MNNPTHHAIPSIARYQLPVLLMHILSPLGGAQELDAFRQCYDPLPNATVRQIEIVTNQNVQPLLGNENEFVVMDIRYIANRNERFHAVGFNNRIEWIGGPTPAWNATTRIRLSAVPYHELSEFTIEAWIADWKEFVFSQGRMFPDRHQAIWLSIGDNGFGWTCLKRYDIDIGVLGSAPLMGWHHVATRVGLNRHYCPDESLATLESAIHKSAGEAWLSAVKIPEHGWSRYCTWEEFLFYPFSTLLNKCSRKGRRVETGRDQVRVRYSRPKRMELIERVLQPEDIVCVQGIFSATDKSIEPDPRKAWRLVRGDPVRLPQLIVCRSAAMALTGLSGIVAIHLLVIWLPF